MKKIFELIKAKLNIRSVGRSHVRYSLICASLDCNENRHAQVVMKELKIKYQHATPQSVGDQWWFWNCENLPIKLPKYLTVLDVDPMECVGFGLDKKTAEAIRDYA